MATPSNLHTRSLVALGEVMRAAMSLPASSAPIEAFEVCNVVPSPEPRCGPRRQ